MPTAQKDWLERLTSLRERLGVSQEEMANLLGVSREWISRTENGKVPVTEFVQLKMNVVALEKFGHTIEELDHMAVAGEDAPPRGDYVKSRKQTVGDLPKGESVKRTMTLTPKFSATPTREDCEAYLKAILDAAPAAEVSFAFILRKLKNALPPADFEPDEKE